MKRIIIALAIVIASSISSYAQERAAGIRVGASGFDMVYQHSLSKNTFIEGNMGFDFGARSNTGLKFTGTYNMILARPAWTDMGSWALYAGAGVSIGDVYDLVKYDFSGFNRHYADDGFLMALAFQAGVEFNFDFPLQLAIDMRPMVGLHINDGQFRVPKTNETIKLEKKVTGYNHGILGLIPSLSVRYRF